MRRALFITLAGLLFAFTFFYVAEWPSTVASTAGTTSSEPSFVTRPDVTVWVALGPFHLVGRKKVTINTVQLSQPSVGLEFVDSRIDLGSALGGKEKGTLGSGSPALSDAARIEALPSTAGHVLHEGDHGTIYVAFSAHTPGSYSFKGIVLSYEAGWLTRTVVIGPPVQATVS